MLTVDNHSATPQAHDDPLHGMKEFPQWVGWQYGQPKRGQKPKKIPVDPDTGIWLSWKDPSTWLFYEQARRHAKLKGLDGYGFVTTAEDEYSFIDIDGCFDPQTKTITKGWVERLVKHIGSYTEISPSGTGLRIIVKGNLDRFKPQIKDHYYLWEGHRLEVFDRDHFVTITENVFLRVPIRKAQPFIESLVPADSSANRRNNTADPSYPSDNHPIGNFREVRKYVVGVMMTHDIDPGPIPEHYRKTTLLSHGGILWKNGMAEGDLWTFLNKINRVLLCNEQGELEGLPIDELEEIHATILKLDRQVAPKGVQNILDEIDGFLASVRPMMKGSKNTDLDLVKALVKHGRKYGSVEGDEIRVDVSQRTVMGLARIKSKDTYYKSRKRLKRRGITGWRDRKDRSGHFLVDPSLLTSPENWGLPKNYAETYQGDSNTPITTNGNTHPHYFGTVDHTFWHRGLGKSKVKYISALISLGGGARSKDIARTVGSAPSSISGSLKELCAMGIVNKPSWGYYELAKDWEERLYSSRVEKGEFSRDEAYREKIKAERENYREHSKEKEGGMSKPLRTHKEGRCLDDEEVLSVSAPEAEPRTIREATTNSVRQGKIEEAVFVAEDAVAARSGAERFRKRLTTSRNLFGEPNPLWAQDDRGEDGSVWEEVCERAGLL